MITENEIEVKIDAAERILIKSFQRLLVLKHGEGNIEDAVLRFQPELAECLYDLMLFYRSLKAEARQFIEDKARFSKSDFSQLMARNQRYSNAVKEVIELGKSIGDAFAWFFYRDNLPELGKHFQHESTGLFVSGIGGRGEIEFIMQQQNMYGFFALYHGITTMLRVGDFSLYEFGNGIVGIGEIKTRKNESCEKRIDIEAYISSKIDFNALKDIPQEKRHIILSPKKSTNRQHLESQLTLQDKLLIQKTADVAASQYGQFEYQLINQVATGNGISLNSDHSLLLLGVHSSHKKLFHILVTEDEHFEIPEGYAACAKKLIHPNAEYNRIIMGQLDTTMHHSRIPVFWWEINDQVCEDIYFKRLHIATAYNPCNIIQHFVELGYSVAETPNHCFSLINSDGGARLELCNFEMFFDLISHSLLKTQSVINIIDGAINELKTGKHGPNTRMDIDIQLHNFGGMPK